jgi:hypothetical protein
MWHSIRRKHMPWGALLLLAVGIAGWNGLILEHSGWAQERSVTLEPDLEALTDRVRDFLQDVAAGQIKPAYQTLLAGGPLEARVEDIARLVEETGRLEKERGKFWELEPLSNERIGNDVVISRFLYKCERYPVVWHVTFYRTFKAGSASAAPTWTVIGVRFDGDLEPLATAR